MKNTRKIVVLSLLFAMILTLNCFANCERVSASQGQGEVYKVNYSYLNVRSGPGIQYEKLGTLDAGEAVKVYEVRDNKWGQIWFHGKIAWISMDYMVRPGNQGTSQPKQESGTQSSKNVQNSRADVKNSENVSSQNTEKENQTYCYDYQITNSYVNVRSGPGTNYEKVGILNQNDVVCVYEIRGSWGRFKINGNSVWFKLDYAKKIYTSVLEESSTAGAAKVLTADGNNAKNNSEGNETQTLKGIIYKVTNDYVNVRSGSSTVYPLVGSLVRGDVVTVYETTSDNWGRISYDGKNAWFCLNYAQKVSSTTQKQVNISSSATASNAATKNSTSGNTVSSVSFGWKQSSGVWKYYNASGQLLFSSNSMHAAWDKIKNQTSQTNYYIVTDTSACETYVFKGTYGNWVPCYKWTCSPGAPQTPTKRGYFTIKARGYSFGSDSYTCYYYTQFSGNYLYHSTLYKKGTLNPLDSRLGQQLSHGCVRLSLSSAKWLYDNIPTGTKVYVY